MTNPFLANQPAAPAQNPPQAPPASPWPAQPQQPAPQQPPANPWPSQPPQSPPAQPPAPPQTPPPAAGPANPYQQPTPPPAAQGQQAGFTGPPSTQPAADPFSTPSGPGDGSKIQDDLNQALLLRPTEHVPQMNTSKGVTEAVRLDWIVLTGPNQGAVRANCFVFNKALVRELKAVLEGPSKFMVAGLVLGQAKNGKDAPYIFVAPLDEHLALARQAAQAYGWV